MQHCSDGKLYELSKIGKKNHQKNQPKYWQKKSVVAIWFLFEDMNVITAGGIDATLPRWK